MSKKRPAGPFDRFDKLDIPFPALDYQKLSVVLWGVVKKLQKRVEKLEKKKGRKGDSD